MAETDNFTEKTATEETRAAVARHKKRERPGELPDPAQEFITIKEEALKRLPAVQGMSKTAIEQTYPNLIRRAHYEELEIVRDNGTTQAEIVFTLWTVSGHAMTTTGDIVQRFKNEHDQTEVLRTVSDNALVEDLHEVTLSALKKTLQSIPHNRIVRIGPHQWAEEPNPNGGYVD